MKAQKNPFSFKEIAIDSPFCDREKELAELSSYAEGKANVVLFSPRRYGKTSLIRRVQKRLADTGAVIIFADFFGVTSIDDMAHRLAKAVFEASRPTDRLFKAAMATIRTFRPVLRPDEAGGISLSVESNRARRSGDDVLDETMQSIGRLIAAAKSLVHIALDEFQEIVQLPDAGKIEGIMRAHIQRYPAACFFIGSRRRLLLAMFNDRQRPFFQSAINYELKVLPQDDLVRFIAERCEEAGKRCDRSTAELIAGKVDRHPYYSQKLSFFAYESAGERVREDDVQNAFGALLESERPLYEAMVQGLAPKQIAVLSAIAREPSRSVFSAEYMRRYDLGSIGGVQGALKRLSSMDFIEQDAGKRWSIVDPVFRLWLCA